MAVNAELALVGDGESLLAGDAELPFDEILSSDELGDGVFDLESRIHFHEIILVFFEVEDELDSSSVEVAHSPSRIDR